MRNKLTINSMKCAVVVITSAVMLTPAGLVLANSEIYTSSATFSGTQGSPFSGALSSSPNPAKNCQSLGWSGSLPSGLSLPSTASQNGSITGVPGVSGTVSGTAQYMCYKDAITDNHNYRWIYNITFNFAPAAPVATTTTTTTTTTTIAPVIPRRIVSPDPVTTGTYTPTSLKSTLINWVAATNALSYRVEVNRVLACTTTATSCEFRNLTGPSDVVQIIAVGESGTTAGPTRAKFVPAWLLFGVINFDVLSSTLRSKDIATLNGIVKLLRKHGFTEIRLTGHTDGDGGISENLDLSSERIASTKSWIDSKLAKKMVLRPKGLTQPVRTNKTGVGRAANRRVTIEIR